jgi:hypothetical protein
MQIKSDYHGNYRLKSSSILLNKLLELGDKAISDLAKLLQDKASRTRKV